MRLMQPIAASPPRPKLPRTERSREAAASVAHLKNPFDDRNETNVPIEQRTPFFVQTGRRRTHRSQLHLSLLGDNKKAGWTEDARFLCPRSFRGTKKAKWDAERYPEDPIEPDWNVRQMQEAWAPETPALANKLLQLRSKLRGTTLEDPVIQSAGDPNGPSLYC